MEKRTKKIYILSFCIVLAIAVIFSIPAFSWCVNKLSTNISITSNVVGSYFEQGDGTEDTPYVIARPIQLYYFAWLQNLGFFDGENTASQTSDKKFYFTLGADINMNENPEYASLPPIGTAEHPFKGIFNGKYHFAPTDDGGNPVADQFDPDNTIEGTYHIISNVVINNTNLSNIPPSGEEGMQYLGLFGVVGSMTDSSVTGEIKNFVLDGITVETNEPIDNKTIIGIVAGYCNGTASGIGVSGCTISVASGLSPAVLPIHTTNADTGEVTTETKSPETLSFSLIGYSDKTYQAYNISPISGGEEFGGSIMMEETYNRILNARNAVSEVSFYNLKTVEVDALGNQTSTFSDETVYQYSNDRYYRLVSNEVVDDEGGIIESYGLIKRFKNNSFNETTDEYMYLVGGFSTDVTRSVKTITQTNEDAYIISDGNGNYLAGNKTSFSNITSSAEASVWRFSNGLSGGTFSIEIDGTRYYLRNNNGTLSMSTTSTSWTILNGQIKNNDYLLCFDNGTWALKRADKEYTISNGNGRYLNYSSGISAGTSSTTKWYVDENNKIYTFDGSNKRYLRNNNGSLTTSNNANNAAIWTINVQNGQLKTGNYYLKCTSSWFGLSWNWELQTSSATVQIDVTNYDVENEITTTKLKTITNSTETIQVTTADTYIPLTLNDDGSVSSKNTGYIVSGSNYVTDGGYPGDIRVSRYAISSNLNAALNSKSYSSSNLEVVTRTYLSNGFCRISDDYNASNNSVNSDLRNAFENKKTVLELGLDKYSDSRSQLHETLNGATNVYGLHFMDAQINMNNLVSINKAVINHSTYSNYPMPQDCIDFNLSTKGYLNFFAGTYFPTNTAFFSLHHIARNGTQITSIKEISKIYGDPTNSAKSYVYEYVGESTPSLPNGYVLMFDTSWLTAPQMVENAMYYFEIPVNSGEYALGSVSGKNGAYLIYLDIGASAKTLGDGTTLETSIKGMDFVTQEAITRANIESTLEAITDESIASAVIVLKNRFQGSISFVRTDYEESGVDKIRITYTLSDESALDYVKWTKASNDTEIVFDSSS